MITLNKKTSPRQNGYFKRVAAFINTNGPLFKLVRVEAVEEAGTCDCCGYQPLMNLYWVKNDSGQEFKIGSECQLFVLGTEGIIPANKLRQLSRADLETIAANLGVSSGAGSPFPLSDTDLVKAIIDVRRSKANAKGWVSRRAVQPATQAPVIV